MKASPGAVVAYTSLPVISTIVGGAIPLVRTPTPSVRSAIQHFAAGVVFAVVGAELLPDVKRVHAPAGIAASFASGVVLMLALRRWTAKSEHAAKGVSRWPWGLLIAVGTDLLIDGLLLGIGFAAGAREGRLLAVALAVEGLSLGIATSATVTSATGNAPAQAIGIIALLASLFAVGAGLGVTFLSGLKGSALGDVLAFGCAALLYLVTEELLVEAHEVPETTPATALFFAGFLLIFLVA